ncbi:MAG: hypothetical protein ABI035_12725 [Gemmatimonadaceae bacterium]
MRIRFFLSAVVLTATVFACNGTSSTDAGTSIAGAWLLKSLNGTDVPAVLSVSGNDTTFLDTELLILPPAGKYSRTTNKVTDSPSIFGSPVTGTSSGTYARKGSGYSFNDDSLGVGTGSLTNGMLTIAFGGQVHVFSLP